MSITISKPGKPPMSRLWYNATEKKVGVMTAGGLLVCIVTGQGLATSALLTHSSYEGDWGNLPVGTSIKFMA